MAVSSLCWGCPPAGVTFSQWDQAVVTGPALVRVDMVRDVLSAFATLGKLCHKVVDSRSGVVGLDLKAPCTG